MEALEDLLSDTDSESATATGGAGYGSKTLSALGGSPLVPEKQFLGNTSLNASRSTSDIGRGGTAWGDGAVSPEISPCDDDFALGDNGSGASPSGARGPAIKASGKSSTTTASFAAAAASPPLERPDRGVVAGDSDDEGGAEQKFPYAGGQGALWESSIFGISRNASRAEMTAPADSNDNHDEQSDENFYKTTVGSSRLDRLLADRDFGDDFSDTEFMVEQTAHFGAQPQNGKLRSWEFSQTVPAAAALGGHGDNLLQQDVVREEESLDVDAQPIRARGSYKLDNPDGASATSVASTTAGTVALEDSNSAGQGSVTGGKARPFLRKGSRMQKSEIPSGDTGKPSVAVVHQAPKKLRLQGNSTSETPASRVAPCGAPSQPSRTAQRVKASPLRGGAERRESADACSETGALDCVAAVRQTRASVPPILGRPELDTNEFELPTEKVGGYGARAQQASRERQASTKRTNVELQAGGMAPIRSSDNELVGEWADSLPWDCRNGDLDVELDTDEVGRLGGSRVPLGGEPPTSRVVESYFRSASRPGRAEDKEALDAREPKGGRHLHWEGDDAYGALYGRPSSTLTKQTKPALSHGSARRIDAGELTAGEEEMQEKFAAMDQQVKKHERENELLVKLQAQAQQQSRDLAREREKLLRDVEAERRALSQEFDAERSALRRERKRLGQNAERQKEQIAVDKSALDEKRKLRERVDQLEEEVAGKEKRWQRTVDRLQRQVGELTQKNLELQEEVKRAGQQVLDTTAWQEPRRSASVGSARGARRQGSVTPASRAAWQANPASPALCTLYPRSAEAIGKSRYGSSARGQGSLGLEECASEAALADASVAGPVPADTRHSRTPASASDCPGRPLSTHDRSGLPRGRLGDAGIPSDIALIENRDSDMSLHRSGPADDDVPSPDASQEVREVRSLDGRTERIYADSHREVEFANGLRKVMYPDGRTSVQFQNGDSKEIHPDGMIVYRYCATGAVQTTLPDSTELYRFADGQFERHRPDGSKEIQFPNGTSKKIQLDGTEEVRFADGTVRRATSISRARPA